MSQYPTADSGSGGGEAGSSELYGNGAGPRGEGAGRETMLIGSIAATEFASDGETLISLYAHIYSCRSGQEALMTTAGNDSNSINVM